MVTLQTNIICELFFGPSKAVHCADKDRTFVKKESGTGCEGTVRTWQYHRERRKYKQKQLLKKKLVTVFSRDLFLTCLSNSKPLC
jgi:hypothetical protein